ncbi:MAG TPA: hypothetical protein VGV89_10780 [Thermoplasmata archaeon]|nr:hypothetical protein [Thermoplasmata archaeon]
MARDNSRYDFVEVEEVATSTRNLLESYYVLADAGEATLVVRILEELSPIAVDLPKDLIPEIARFRLAKKGATGRRFSYAAAAGYVYALDRGHEFLTGAEEFEGLERVRFVR